jgi:hypothetical protein
MTVHIIYKILWNNSIFAYLISTLFPQCSLSFDVLRQLLIHLMESLIRLEKKAPVNYLAVRDRTEFILDQTLAWIISQVCMHLLINI